MSKELTAREFLENNQFIIDDKEFDKYLFDEKAGALIKISDVFKALEIQHKESVQACIDKLEKLPFDPIATTGIKQAIHEFKSCI